MRSNDFGKGISVFGVMLAIGVFFASFGLPAFEKLPLMKRRLIDSPAGHALQCRPADPTLQYRELKDDGARSDDKVEENRSLGPLPDSPAPEYWLGEGPRFLLHREKCVEKETLQ